MSSSSHRARAGLGPLATAAATVAAVGILATTAGADAAPRDHRPATPGHSSEVALARAFYAAVDARPFDPEAVRRLLAPDFVDRNRPLGFDGLSDRDTIVALLSGLAAAFPDGRHHLERVEPVGRDEVLLYWRFTGTHTGAPIFGVPAAGAAVDFVGTDLFRADRGRFVEQRHVEDLATLTRQLTPTT
jgi:predicted ester cyclase